MTGLALPIDASGGAPSFSGRQHRNAIAALSQWDGAPLAGRSGIRPMGGTAANIVTLSGTTITVATHAGLIAPGWATATGVYQVALTAAETPGPLTAQGANPRKDIVVGRVYDDTESTSGLRTYRSEYIAGTPGPSPTEPSVPPGAIKLAVIDVPASGGGSPAVTQTYPYTTAAGGVLLVRTQAERDAISNPYDGYAVYRADRNWVEIHDGTAWRVQGVAVCSSGTDRDAAITNPYSGQLAIVTNVGLVYRYDGAAWQKLVPSRVTNAQDAVATTTSTTYTSSLSGGSGASGIFVAPPSGEVDVEVTANAEHSGASAGCASFEIRTGSTVGAGTVVQSANDNTALLSGGGTGIRATVVTPISGLTPGATYNTRQMFRASGAGTATFIWRRITVKPVW